MNLMILSLLLLSFIVLCAAMKKHFKKFFPRTQFTANKSRFLATLGYSGIIGSIYLMTHTADFSINLVIALGWVSLITLFIALALSFVAPKK